MRTRFHLAATLLLSLPLLPPLRAGGRARVQRLRGGDLTRARAIFIHLGGGGGAARPVALSWTGLARLA